MNEATEKLGCYPFRLDEIVLVSGRQIERGRMLRADLEERNRAVHNPEYPWSHMELCESMWCQMALSAMDGGPDHITAADVMDETGHCLPGKAPLSFGLGREDHMFLWSFSVRDFSSYDAIKRSTGDFTHALCRFPLSPIVDAEGSLEGAIERVAGWVAPWCLEIYPQEEANKRVSIFRAQALAILDDGGGPRIVGDDLTAS